MTWTWFLPLVVVPLVPRLLPAGDLEGRWRWTVDLPLTLLSGALLAGLGGAWLASFPLSGEPAVIDSPDFVEYCGSVSAELLGRLDQWSHNRSRLSGLPAVLAARRLGVVDGLLAGALMGQVALGAGLFVWGRAVHSRLAGVSAALLACAMVPLAVLGRTLTFYPEIVGGLTLATASAAVAFRWPSAWTAALGGAGAGLAFLVDLRGLLWGLPIVGMVALASLFETGGRPVRVLGRWLALAVPVWMAWWLGRYAYTSHTTTLEVLSDLTQGWEDVLPGVVPSVAPSFEEGGYVWGWSSPLRIPQTVLFLAEQGKSIPDAVRSSARTMAAVRTCITPLMGLVWAAAAIALIGLRRHPRRLVALAGTCLPFVVAFQGAIDSRFAGMRFLSNGFVFLPLLMGLGWAVLAHGASAETPAGRRPWRSLASALLLLLLVMGMIPSWLSPVAPWRHAHDMGTNTTVVATLQGVSHDTKWPLCVLTVRTEQQDGKPTWIHHLP